MGEHKHCLIWQHQAGFRVRVQVWWGLGRAAAWLTSIGVGVAGSPKDSPLPVMTVGPSPDLSPLGSSCECVGSLLAVVACGQTQTLSLSCVCCSVLGSLEILEAGNRTGEGGGQLWFGSLPSLLCGVMILSPSPTRVHIPPLSFGPTPGLPLEEVLNPEAQLCWKQWLQVSLGCFTSSGLKVNRLASGPQSLYL